MTDRCQDLIDSFYSDWSIVLMLICEELLVLEASGKLEDTELLYNQVAVFVLLLKFPFYLFKSWKFSIVLELTVCLGYRFFSMKYLMRIIGPGWWNYRKEWQLSYHKTMKPYIELLPDVFTVDVIIGTFILKACILLKIYVRVQCSSFYLPFFVYQKIFIHLCGNWRQISSFSLVPPNNVPAH